MKILLIAPVGVADPSLYDGRVNEIEMALLKKGAAVHVLKVRHCLFKEAMPILRPNFFKRWIFRPPNYALLLSWRNYIIGETLKEIAPKTRFAIFNLVEPHDGICYHRHPWYHGMRAEAILNPNELADVVLQGVMA